MGSRGAKSKSVGVKEKKKNASSLPKITTSDGKVSTFATGVRDTIYNHVTNGEKLDVTNFMSRATADTAKQQSVMIAYQKMSKKQRYILADALSNSKFDVADSGGYGMGVYPKGFIHASDAIYYTLVN